MKKLTKLALAGALLTGLMTSPLALAKDSFKICWSHYTGWEPYGLMEQTGILQKWEEKYGIDIDIVLINDYIESINLYTAGEFDGCSMTNMDALTIPAVGGVDSTALIYGDYSNGNDGIVIKNGNSVKDLAGREVMLVELSVSHYVLSRVLEENGLSERDLTVMNTSDADIASVFMSMPDAATVTWNPPLQVVRNTKGAKLVFDSSQLPGEIMDLLVVRTDADERLKKAITGAWYELMGMLGTKGPQSKNLVSLMAANSGATEAEFNAQLKTTYMFYDPAEAVKQVESDNVMKTMDYVRQFSFDHGLFGQGAADPDFVGIEFPNGDVLGSKSNVKFRFDSSYMNMAAKGQL